MYFEMDSNFGFKLRTYHRFDRTLPHDQEHFGSSSRPLILTRITRITCSSNIIWAHQARDFGYRFYRHPDVWYISILGRFHSVSSQNRFDCAILSLSLHYTPSPSFTSLSITIVTFVLPSISHFPILSSSFTIKTPSCILRIQRTPRRIHPRSVPPSDFDLVPRSNVLSLC